MPSIDSEPRLSFLVLRLPVDGVVLLEAHATDGCLTASFLTEERVAGELATTAVVANAASGLRFRVVLACQRKTSRSFCEHEDRVYKMISNRPSSSCMRSGLETHREGAFEQSRMQIARVESNGQGKTKMSKASPQLSRSTTLY